MLTDAVVAFDHVRRVITITGEPEAVERVATALASPADRRADRTDEPG